VSDAIDAVLDRQGVSACARVRLAVRRLERVPDALRAARIQLRDPPRALTEQAIVRFEGVLRFYRETVPALAAGCRSALMQADLAQADTAAVRAVETFIAYLREDLLPVSNGALAIGPEGCRRLLESELLMQVAPIETLLVAEGRSLDRRRDALEALAPGVAAGGLKDALDSLAAGPPPEGGRIAAVAERLGQVSGYVRDHTLVSAPERLELGVRTARPHRTPAGPVALRSPGPWEPDPAAAWLEVDAGTSLAVSRWETDLAIAHEGMPGRYARALSLRGSRTRAVAALLSEWPAEAWGRYAETMLIDQGFGASDPRYRFAAALRALRHEGLSFAALCLHSGSRSLDEVTAMLAERCLLPPEVAAREARSAAANPALMGYTLGARSLLELRDEARTELGPRFRITSFDDAVLRHGATPVGLVREGVRRELGVGEVGTPIGAKP
jgi:hypothetical protein